MNTSKSNLGAASSDRHQSNPQPDTSIVALGEKRYATLKKELERDHFGEFVVLIIGSTEIVVGRTCAEAADLHEKLYPHTRGYLRQIGIKDYGRKFWL